MAMPHAEPPQAPPAAPADLRALAATGLVQPASRITYRFAVAARLDFYYCKSVVLVEERDALDQPGQALGKWRWWLGRHDGAILRAAGRSGKRRHGEPSFGS